VLLSEPNGGLRSSLVRLLTGSLRSSGQPRLAPILRVANDVLRRGDLVLTLRHLDRAWRLFPDCSFFIAPMYARALMLESGDCEAALGMAQLAVESAPDPEIAAVKTLALLRLGRIDQAVGSLENALSAHCVEPDGALAAAADEVLRHPSVEAPGWIGLGPDLALVSRLSPGADPNQLEVRAAGRQRHAHCSGRRLLGTGARTPTDFLLDGRVSSQGRQLTAWAHLGFQPSAAPRLRFTDDDGRSIEVQTAGPSTPGWRWRCAVDLDATMLRGGRIHVLAKLPDGAWHALPDAPLLLERRLPKPARRRPVAALRTPRRRQVDIIIPVYGNRTESLACIESALQTACNGSRVVVVDDASDDPQLELALDRLSQSGHLTLLRNAQNLGFAGAVNRGIAYDPTRDVVLLNSDTLVSGDWLNRLQSAAYSHKDIGSITPLSNNGSIASYPHRSGSSALTPDAAAALNALAAVTNDGLRVEIPVGVGFCLYLRRDCLNAVGTLDAAVFGKGYGEETDFCMRARQQGWKHFLAADVYVSHAGGLTFGARRAALLDRSQRLLNLRHPGYDRSIQRFLAGDTVHALRRNLDEQRLRLHPGRCVLIVTLALTGGVDRFVKHRCLQLRAMGFTPVLLRAARPRDLKRCELFADDLDLPSLQYAIPRELPALQQLLRGITFEFIEIQHFLHLDARVIEVVRALGAPYDVFMHDYAWLCPRVTLIDGSGRYCGEPEVSTCEACVTRHGSNLVEKLSVRALRSRSATWLDAARRVIAPSEDTAIRIRRHFDGLPVEVRPHAPPESATAQHEPAPRGDRDIVRIALIGAIGAHKGYRVLLECARDARARRLPIEYVVIGFTENDAPLIATGKVFITGPYIDGEAPHLIERERPDLAWLPSVWPETWCYTLDHALAARLPVAAFDLGAIAERLRGTARTLLLPLKTESRCINDALLQFVNEMRVPTPAPMSSVKSVPTPHDGIASIDEVKLRRIRMSKSANGKAPAENQEPGLSASVQVLPLAAGLYLFSVKAAKTQLPSSTGQLALPAMHVGLGPGVRSEQVEFLASASTHGGWLFSATDQLVARVNGNGAVLVLTSVRAPTGDVLTIKVERLESRIETSEATAQVAAVKPAAFAAAPRAADAPLPIQISAHVRARGDMQFRDAPWAGRVAPGLWIESYAVLPMAGVDAQDIEYKGLTGSGFETAWLSDNTACGTKGMGVPLVGFALRLRPSGGTAAYECEYSGYFQSGLTVGPLRNGAPCRSSVANDPLEGIQVRLLRRSQAASVPKRAQPVLADGDRGLNNPKPRAPASAAVKSGKRAALAR
jgi:GT2 family glycosyltransferase